MPQLKAKGFLVPLLIGAAVFLAACMSVFGMGMFNPYATASLGVGLLSIGEERSKGNELTRGAYELLERSGLNFVGNVEGRDVFAGKVDVVVTDGFVGNVVLKFTESIIYYITSLIRDEVGRHAFARIGGLLMRPVFRGIRRTLDYAEYGGARDVSAELRLEWDSQALHLALSLWALRVRPWVQGVRTTDAPPYLAST